MTARNWTVLLLFILLLGIGASATPPKVQYQADLVPAYGGSYSQTDDLLLQIRDELKGLRKDVQSLKPGAGSQQDAAVGILAAKCLSCHQDGKAEDKGGGFVLVEKDGALTELSVPQKRTIRRLVQQGKMPPSGKLPESEVKLLTEFFAPKEEKPK